MGRLHPVFRQGRGLPLPAPGGRLPGAQPQLPHLGADGRRQGPVGPLPRLSPLPLRRPPPGRLGRLPPRPLVPPPQQQPQGKILVQPHQGLGVGQAEKPHHQVDHRAPRPADKAVKPPLVVGEVGPLPPVDGAGDPPPGGGGQPVAPQRLRQADAGLDLLRRAPPRQTAHFINSPFDTSLPHLSRAGSRAPSPPPLPRTPDFPAQRRNAPPYDHSTTQNRCSPSESKCPRSAPRQRLPSDSGPQAGPPPPQLRTSRPSPQRASRQCPPHTKKPGQAIERLSRPGKIESLSEKRKPPGSL